MELSSYDSKHVRVKDKFGGVFVGVAAYHDAEYCLAEYGTEENAVKIGEDLIYESEIASIEEIEVHGTAEIWTDRLVLRRHRPEDAEDLYRYFGADPEMTKYSGWNPYRTLQTARQTVSRFMESYRDEHFYGWAIESEDVLFGMGAVLLFGQRRSTGSVDFPHLSERVMLYVVLTFGEMIIAIAAYFEGEFSLRSTYFALMAFLIVVGLFLSYGVFYDHIIDREKKTNGLGFMLLHIIIIFAMNNITNGLEFMRDETVALLPKTAFLAGSFLLFFGFLFALGLRYAKARCSQYSRFCLRAAGLGILFSALMLLLRQEMLVNIALTVVFVFAMLGLIHHYGKQINQSI